MGAGSLGLLCNNQHNKALISITANKYLSKSCHIDLIYYLRNSTKVPTFLQVFTRKIKNLIRMDLKSFPKKKLMGERLFGRYIERYSQMK